ncbi:unnamed protein product [Sphenostylis stenocarpa]|uniref:Uncharacterized protein n=1 Tax=Sphenostylis stenocarpa TaxID=92480 RepID=A0AA86RZT6_9FABA|nr:unnamed protein product [Sphenostylis stenocarpa]
MMGFAIEEETKRSPLKMARLGDVKSPKKQKRLVHGEGRQPGVVCGQCVKGFPCLYCFVVLHSLLVECGIGESLGSVVSVFIVLKLSFLSLEDLEVWRRVVRGGSTCLAIVMKKELSLVEDGVEGMMFDIVDDPTQSNDVSLSMIGRFATNKRSGLRF